MNKKIGCRKASRLANMSDVDARAEQIRHAQDPDGNAKWYTLGMRGGVRAMCNGADLDTAHGSLWGLNSKQLPHARMLLQNFEAIRAANDDIDFTATGPVKRHVVQFGQQAVNVDHDLVCKLADGREAWVYIQVANAPLKEQQNRDLLHLAKYIADAQAVNAVVLILDLPRARLIRVYDDYDPSHLHRVVKEARRKLIE